MQQIETHLNCCCRCTRARKGTSVDRLPPYRPNVALIGKERMEDSRMGRQAAPNGRSRCQSVRASRPATCGSPRPAPAACSALPRGAVPGRRGRVARPPGARRRVDARPALAARQRRAAGQRIWYYRDPQQEPPFRSRASRHPPGRAPARRRQAALPADDPDRALPARDAAGAPQAAARPAAPDADPPPRPRDRRRGHLLAQPGQRGTYQSMFQKRSVQGRTRRWRPCCAGAISLHLPQPHGRRRQVLRHEAKRRASRIRKPWWN